MGSVQTHRPVLLILAAFSRHREGLAWAGERAATAWGPLALESDVFAFDQTPFYEPTMGSGLLKVFFAFESLVDPARLPAIKRLTNEWEDEYQRTNAWPEPRPLNLDPGYVTEAKLVLATTKDRDHRIYLGEGIFGEVTLYYHRGQWQARPWTYPDYQQPEYHAFFDQCRQYLRQQYAANVAQLARVQTPGAEPRDQDHPSDTSPGT